MSDNTGNKKHISFGKYPPQGTDVARSDYYAAFIAEWNNKYEARQEEAQISPTPSPALFISTDKPVSLPVKRHFWAILVLLFSVAALAVIVLSHFEVFSEYTKFSFLTIKEIFGLFGESAPSCLSCKIAHYALPAALIVACLLLAVSVAVSAASIASRKKICQTWAVASSFVFSLTIFVWLYILAQGSAIGFVKFASPFEGKVYFGYYAFAALQLLAFLSSLFVYKRTKG